MNSEINLFKKLTIGLSIECARSLTTEKFYFRKTLLQLI